ncbi:MAG: glycosyltransferase [Desulforhabdus sp.]|jgi:cellulose synthase/poly-beta-1,6-N-acetylglucosamine synthase-like glycosyltransferase|nr:glycosyltransferase [Desulforhabdus sp.]
MMVQFPSVTVIIPAFNASATLPRCLEALRRQTYPAELVRIIVVDDGSTDDTKEIALDFGVDIVTQCNKGAASARNQGAQKAQSDLILFTDSDCEPIENWIAEMAAPFTAPDVVGAKGFYRSNQSNLTARFVQAEYEIKCRGLKPRDIIDFIDTYSAAYRCGVFIENGGFDTSYQGAAAEDIEFSYRLSNKGYRLVAAYGAFVLHRHPESIRDYFRKKCRYAYWRAVTWQKHPQKAVNDSYTPNAQKLEVLFSPLLVLLLTGTLCWPAAFSAVFLLFILLFTLNELSYFRQTRNDLCLLVSVPLFTFLRGMAGAIGVGARLTEIALSRPLGSFRFCR